MKRILLLTTIVLISLLSLVCYRDDLYNNTSSKTLAMVSLLPLLRTIYIFTDPANTYTGNLGGRAGADLLCQNLYASTYSFLDVSVTVKAFISVMPGDNIKDLAPGYPATAAVYGVTSVGTITPIANTWDDLWNTASVPLLNDLNTATDASISWWSGSDPNGLYDNSMTADNNCSNWTNGTIFQDGQVGDRNSTGPVWLIHATNPRLCSTLHQLMCVAY